MSLGWVIYVTCTRSLQTVRCALNFARDGKAGNGIGRQQARHDTAVHGVAHEGRLVLDSDADYLSLT